MRLRLLGTFDGDGDARAQRLLAQPKRAAVLAYLLAARPNGPVARDALLAMFWPELDTSRARNALNQALHFLRSVLGQDVVVAHGTTRVGVPMDRVATDLDEFRSAVARGDHEAATSSYRGDFLAGVHLSGTPEFERWLDATRGELRAAALTAVGALARSAETQRNEEAHLRWLRRATEIDPLEEAPVRALGSALERYGRPAEAIRVLDAYAERLREMGVTPTGHDAARLARRIREAAARVPTVEPEPATDARSAVPAAAAQPPTARWTPRQRMWIRFAAAALIVVLGATALMVNRRQASASRSAALAVLPFEVVGDTTHAYLGDALATLLTTHFDAIGVTPVVSPQAVGARQGAGRVVQGRVTVRGGTIMLDARLRDVVNDTVLAEASTTSPLDELFTAADRLSAELAGSLASTVFPTASGRVVKIASRSTASLAAFRAYLEGERLRTQGRYHGATVAFLQATKLDPDFALAHYRLALVSDWAGDGQWSRASTDAALLRADRLTPRYRGLVSAVRYYMARDLVRGERDLLRLISGYPDESEAWFLLGELRFHYGPLFGRPMLEAKPAFEEVLRLEPDHAEATLHLARIAAFERDARAFRRYAARLRSPARADERQLELDAIDAFFLGDDEARRRIINQLGDRSEIEVDVASKAVAVYAGDLDGAAAIAEHLTVGRSDGWRARALAWRAQLAAGRGHWDVAAAQLDSVAEIAPAFAVEMRAALAAVPTSPRAFADDARARVLSFTPDSRPVPDAVDVLTLDAARRLYLAAIIDARLGDSVAGAARGSALAQLADTPVSVRREYGRSIEAAHAFTRRDWATVASVLAPAEDDASGEIGNSLQMGRAWERWARLEALRCLNRRDDAADVRGSFPEPAGYDVAFERIVVAQPSQACTKTLR